MIVEYRSYHLHAGRLADYLGLFGKRPEALALLLPHLRGFWFAESGTLNAVHHLWSYESREARARIRTSIAANPVMPAFFGEVTPLIRSQRSVVFEGEIAAPRTEAVPGCYDRVGVALNASADPAAIKHTMMDIDRALSSGFERVATLRRGWLETSGPVTQALYVLRSTALADRADHLKAANEALAAAARHGVVASVDHGLMFPVLFSPWR